MSSEKWIIATGLSRGIGFEFSKLLKDSNYKIIHLGRKKTGYEDVFIWWDLLNTIKDNPLNDLIKAVYGKPLIGFFYGAGVMPFLTIDIKNKIQKHSFLQSQIEAMQVNYHACAELIEELIPYLMPHTERKISDISFVAHMSSLSAVDPFAGLELYGATKSAALMYFNWLSKRFTSNEISCLSIHPGTVKTEMVTNLIATEPNDMVVVKVFKKLIEKGGIMEPKAAAEKIFHFLFGNSEIRKQAHGLLYLTDEEKIYKKP